MEKVTKHRMREPKQWTEKEMAIGRAFAIQRKIALLEIKVLMKDYDIALEDLKKNGF
jgi:hypothetical protein